MTRVGGGVDSLVNMGAFLDPAHPLGPRAFLPEIDQVGAVQSGSVIALNRMCGTCGVLFQNFGIFVSSKNSGYDDAQVSDFFRVLADHLNGDHSEVLPDVYYDPPKGVHKLEPGHYARAAIDLYEELHQAARVENPQNIVDAAPHRQVWLVRYLGYNHPSHGGCYIVLGRFRVLSERVLMPNTGPPHFKPKTPLKLRLIEEDGDGDGAPPPTPGASCPVTPGMTPKQRSTVSSLASQYFGSPSTTRQTRVSFARMLDAARDMMGDDDESDDDGDDAPPSGKRRRV